MRAVRGLLESQLAAIGASVPHEFFLRMERMVETLVLWGSRTNLTARPDDPAELVFHIVDSLMPIALAARTGAEVSPQLWAQGSRILDVGSGAGFPGLVLASACEASFTLVEARRKRASFLKVVSGEMKLANVSVLQSRLAPADLDGSFDAVVARAMGAPADFYLIAARAASIGGIALLYANPGQRLNLDAAREAGLDDYRRIPYELIRAGHSVKRLLTLWTRRS